MINFTRGLVVIVGFGIFVSPQAFATTCDAVRVQRANGKSTATEIQLKHNEVFEKNNPGKQSFNELDATLPYGLTIGTDGSNDDVTVIIRLKNQANSSAGASGSLASNGKFDTTLILNSASSNDQDILNVVCKR